ncbi:jg1271, partial [Pararge aegeria aegeria]
EKFSVESSSESLNGARGNRLGRWPFCGGGNAVCNYRRVTRWDRWVRDVMSE